MYAIYQYEPISSGALAENGESVDFSDRTGFPKRHDMTLSRYSFARGYDTWLNTVAVLPDRVIGGYRHGNEIIPFSDDFNTLYIGNIADDLVIKVPHNVRIIAGEKIKISGDNIIRIKIKQ